MKQPNRISPGDPRRPISPRRVALDANANAWAARMHAERARREALPATPVPTVADVRPTDLESPS